MSDLQSGKLNITIDKVIDSPDKRPRSLTGKWTGIVIHHTGVGDVVPTEKSAWQKLNENLADWLSKKDANYLSAHYQIGHFGELTQLVDPFKFEAFHAGVSSFWNPNLRKWADLCNQNFIGIELVGDGNKFAYTEEQYAVLARLCHELMIAFPYIQPNCIVGHEMVSPTRKVDPGQFFNWRAFFSELYALETRIK